MYECPSVGELKDRGYEPHHGKVSYCDHCLALYGPVARAFGFDMGWEIDYDDRGLCSGSCRWWASAMATEPVRMIPPRAVWNEKGISLQACSCLRIV